MSSHSIPAELQELLAKLEFLSMIQRGYKINVNAMNFVDGNSMIDKVKGALTRTLSKESRDITMKFIKDTVNRTIECIEKYEQSRFIGILINTLAMAKLGIQRLATTYQADPQIVSELNVRLANIDLQLEHHRNLLQGMENKRDDSSKKR